MNAPHVLDELPLWAGGDLAPQDQQRVDLHLAGCPTCRSAAEALRASQAWLKEPLGPIFTADEQARFRQEVMTQVRAQPRRLRVPYRRLAALAAVLLCALTATLVRPRGTRRPVSAPPPAIARAAPPASSASPPPVRVARATQVRRRPRPEAAAGPDRIEIQTSDPRIRIIWLARARTPAAPAAFTQEQP